MKLIMYFLLLNLLIVFSVSAGKIKIGLLAPEGTNWSNYLKKMSKEIKKETKGKVKLKFYFGGSQGDEPDILRKIRIGQLQGGVFTGKTLGEINGNVRLMEIPFNFGSDRKKAWRVLSEMTPLLNSEISKKGFVNLGFFEIGSIYFVSVKPFHNFKELTSLKTWSWAGDKLVEAMVEEMNLLAVPLPLPDVLGALSTGIVEGAYAPPLGIMALQWNSKIKYLLDVPLAYSVGAILIDKKRWNKITKEIQIKIRSIAKEYVSKINKGNITDNKKALQLMKNSGVNFISFPQKDLTHMKLVRKKLIKKLEGKLFDSSNLVKFNSFYK